MQITSVRDFRNNLAEYLDATDAVVVTKHGKPAGFYLPMNMENEAIDKLKRKLFLDQAEKMSQLTQHIEEGEIEADFEKWRKERRHR